MKCNPSILCVVFLLLFSASCFWWSNSEILSSYPARAGGPTWLFPGMGRISPLPLSALGPLSSFPSRLLLLLSVPASGVSKTQAIFPASHSAQPEPPSLELVLPPAAAVLGRVSVEPGYAEGVPTLYLREPLCAPCCSPWPGGGGGSSHFHTAPVNPSQEELAGTELMGPACVEVLPNYPQKPWALLGTPKPSHLQGPRKGQPEATAGIPRGLTERAWPRPRGAAPRGQ